MIPKSGNRFSDKIMRKTKERRMKFHAFAIALAALSGGQAYAQASDPPKLNTHQSYMEEVLRPGTLDVKDPLAVFGFVLNSLPDRVKVYPTENYYYFTFTLNGSPYAGNIRLDASDIRPDRGGHGKGARGGPGRYRDRNLAI